MAFECVSRTDVGLRRKVNEDSLLVRTERGLWAVADGMGGHDAGDVASSKVTESLLELPETDDLDRLEFHLDDACRRVPILAKAGLSRVINGPIPYAPDGNPLIGPMPGVENAFEACVFTFGIAQAGGAGKVLAEWVTEGRTEWDMWSCDPRRFTKFASDPDYCVAKGMEIYGHEYAIQFPRRPWPAGPPSLLPTSDF